MALQLVEVCRRDGLTVVSLAAVILDESNSTDLKMQILMLAEGLPERRLYVDLSKVQVLSAAALRALLTLRKSLGKVSCEMILANLTSSVAAVFQATRLDRVFDIRRVPAGMPMAGSSPTKAQV